MQTKHKVTTVNMVFALRTQYWFSTIPGICPDRIVMRTVSIGGRPSVSFIALWLFWLPIALGLKVALKSFVSSVPERQTVKRGIVMSMVKHKRGSVSALSAQHEAELKALANKPDDDIDYSDVPVTEDEQWSEAHRGKFFRPLKTQASVRIDADVMEWLKRPGKGYQTRLNAILREAMLREQNKK